MYFSSKYSNDWSIAKIQKYSENSSKNKIFTRENKHKTSKISKEFLDANTLHCKNR